MCYEITLQMTDTTHISMEQFLYLHEFDEIHFSVPYIMPFVTHSVCLHHWEDRFMFMFY